MTARTAFAPIDFKTRFPALDGIRALAVTMVFLDHFGGGSHGGHVLQYFNLFRERLWVGVDLFFVLSGFLITGILYDTRNDSRFFRRFFARRSLRIFPVFYLVCAVLLLLTPVFQYQWHWQHLTFLVYIGNWWANGHFWLYDIQSANHPTARAAVGHFWSLFAEEQFYIVWPPLVWLVRDRIKLLWLCGGLSLATLALRFYWCHTQAHPGLWIIRTLPFRLDTLLLGAMLALLLRGPRAAMWQRLCLPVFLAGLAGTVAIFAMPALDGDGTLLLTLGLSATALTSVGLIGMALMPGSRSFRLFYFKPFRTLGKYSYGFYIFHFIYSWAWIQLLVKFTGWTHSLLLGGMITIPLNFFTTFLLARMSYDYFEVRFLKYKRHFEYDSEVVSEKHAFTTK